MGLPMAIVGGYWYLRAAIHTGGNPIPQSKFGPLNLPTPDQMPLDPRPRFAVADYLTDPTIYRRWFFPQLENAFGPLWPLILIIAVSAAVYLVWRSNNKIVKVLAAAALATAVVYVFTPLTAAGQEGTPTGFFTNTRYLVPGLVLALTLLPIARPLRVPDARAWKTLAFLTLVYAVTVLATPRWFTQYFFGAVFLTLALVWVPAGLGLGRARGMLSRRRRHRRRGGDPRCRGRPRARAAGPVRRAALHQRRPLPRLRWADPRLRIRPGPRRPADRDHRQQPDHLRPVRLLRQRHLQRSRVHRRTRAARRQPPADHLSRVPPRDQRRRLRLPDPEPGDPGLAPGRLLVPGLRLDQEQPGARDRRRGERGVPAARLRLQGQRQARPDGCANGASG